MEEENIGVLQFTKEVHEWFVNWILYGPTENVTPNMVLTNSIIVI